jgi:hypothetical protein
MALLEKTHLILQRQAVRQAIVSQQKQVEILSVQKEEASKLVASAQEAQKAAESRINSAEKQAAVLSARLVESRKIAPEDPEQNAEIIASQERATANTERLTRLMGRGL